MSRKKIDTSIVTKIEVDQTTKKLKVVDVPEKEFLSQPIIKADFVELKSTKRARKKAVIRKVFGIKKDEEQQNIDKRQKIFKKITTITFIVFMVGVLAYTAYKDFFVNKNFPSASELKDIFIHGWPYLLTAILMFVLSIFFRGLKNVLMCKVMTGKAHFITCMETSIIGLYYNNVTPLAVGGQPFEIYHLSKHGVRGGVASSIPIASFFLNQLAFVILGILSLISFSGEFGVPSELLSIYPPAFYTLTIVGLCCCLFVPSLVILFSMLPRVGAKLVYFVIKLGTKLRVVKNPEQTLQKTIKTVVHNSHCLKKIASKPFLFTGLFFFSFLENIASASIAFFVLEGFGLDLGLPFVIEWIIICSICFILFASITFIPTPGNSGAADLSFFLLFEAVLYAGLAFPAMVIWRLFHFYSTIIVGFTFATIKKKSDLKKAKLQPQTIDIVSENTLSKEEQELCNQITNDTTKNL